MTVEKRDAIWAPHVLGLAWTSTEQETTERADARRMVLRLANRHQCQGLRCVSEHVCGCGSSCEPWAHWRDRADAQMVLAMLGLE
ncbi:hypothetical protein F4561_005212 [Lipingzhangella halophila]|uniref:Uncharacterized protein n=1 Tax=Lipingzhangella halophila TaxID=1783352 RepID=A0A7W7W4P4_9ACTN|nr:hypothetical protein [Lipingzhangella halophila]